MKQPKTLTMREAARYLGIGRSCMCYHLTHGHCKGAVKAGGRWRVPVKDLQHIKRTPGPIPNKKEKMT